MKTIRFYMAAILIGYSVLQANANETKNVEERPNEYSLLMRNENNNLKLVITHQKNILTVSYVNLIREDVKLEVIDQSGIKVYSGVKSNEVIFHERLKTNELDSGEYMVILKVGDASYETTFTLD